jgi:hypothetical protein
LIVAVLFQGLSGVGGGVALLADPTGGLIGMPVSMLARSPFDDFLLPGLILLLVLGVVPLCVSWGLWRRRPWAWRGSVFVGAALVIWIAVQVAMVGYRWDPPLQAIYGGLGVAILALCLGHSRWAITET